MIHHSHVKCDDCGERHTPGNPTECIGILLEQIVELTAERDKLREEIHNGLTSKRGEYGVRR